MRKLTAEAIENAAWPGIRIVSLRNLLALKRQAVKHGHASRVVKDADDVIRLVQINQLDVESLELRELFHQHGPMNSIKKSAELAKEPEQEALELPDWNGMDDSPARITPAAALRLTGVYPALAAAARPGCLRERSQPCPVEFVL